MNSPERIVFDCMIYLQAMISPTGPVSVAPYIEHVGSIPAIYVNPFDPDDSHYINLAAAAQADLITTRDGDLLQLMDDSRAEACEFRKLFPRLKILQPDQVLDLLRQKRAD